MSCLRKLFLCLTLLFLATVSGTATSWSPVRVGGYGPVLGYQSPTLTPSTLLADTLAWRSRGIDPSGFYCLGARYYDPVAGHFLSPDPLGHAASMDLHSFCGGDPINRFDPTDEIGKSIESFGESVEAQMPGEIARFNENLRQADMNYEGTVQQGVIAVGEVALTFALPEVGAALFEEGFGAEAGAGVMFEEEELGAGASSALKTEGSVGGNVESEFGAMEDMKAPTPAASKGLLEEQEEEELVESAPALANDVSEAEQTESKFAEGAKAETADSSGISQSKGANPSSDTPNASPEAAPSQTSGTQAAEDATMFSSQLGSTGPRATTELLDAMQAHGRTITTATEGSEALRFLDTMGAEASAGGEGHLSIILRENPSQSAAMEEFLHGTQDRLGIIDRLGVQGAENHVTDFMTRHSRLLGLEP